MNKNKGRRFLRKALRFRMLFLYLIIIAILVLVGCYTIGGLKASDIDSTADNVSFSYDGFTNQYTETYEDGVDYNTKISENTEYELWFDSSTSIVTVKEKSTGLTYTSAQTDSTLAPGANIVIEYANSSTGKLSNVAYDSMQNSVHYKNPMTDSYERHYYTKLVDGGVQVVYEIGEFNAGLDYLPEYYYATIYKPVKESFTDKDGNIEEESYNTAYTTWVNYMKALGCNDPENADWKEIRKYIQNTFDEHFRGNVEPTVKSDTTTGSWKYTGSVKVYTQEAYEYIKDLIESGKVATTGNESFDEVSKDKYTNNPYWKISGVDTSLFTDYIGVYFNTDDSPLTINPFMQGDAWKFLKDTAYKLISQTDETFLYPYYKRQSVKAATLSTAYNLLYKTKQYEFVDIKYYNEDGTPNMVGGIPARDDDGNYIYENGELKCEYYTLAKTAEMNAMFGVESSSSLPIFQVGLQFLLKDNGLEVTIMGNATCDASNASNSEFTVDESNNKLKDVNDAYLLYDAYLLPYFTYVDNSKIANAADKETGLMVIPDGSGATINFNNGKYEMGASAVNTTYYGADAAYTSKQISEETEDLMLGMYGMIYTTTGKARSVLAVIEKGGNQVALYANTTNGSLSQVAQAYFITTLRANETVKVGAYSSKNIFTKWASRLNTTDFKFGYFFNSYANSEDANYTAIAKQYRKYLMDSQGLTEKDTTDETVVELNFLGAFEKYALMLGFKYKTPDSLTTFKQAQEIVEELTTGIEVNGTTEKINLASVTYTGWTAEELEYQLGGGISVSSKLGGKSGLKNLVSYLAEKNIPLYTEEYITTTKGYDLPFGSLKYTSRSVANNPARVYQFDVATQRQDKKVSSNYMINPTYYNSVASRVNSAMNKLKLTAKASSDTKTGYYLVDLGNMSCGNYKKNNVIYGQEAIEYQQEALASIASKYLVKIKAPYDYALKYADMITDVPLTSTARQIYDSTIPFYQLVVSGLVDYTSEAINGTSSKSHLWFLSKAIETGSNLSFLLSAENPTVLLDTDYTYYYQSYYQNWKEYIVEMASTIDSLGIMKGNLVEHKTIGKNIAYVKYEISTGNDIELYVNTTGSDYTYNSVTIPAYGYVKIN